MVGARGTEKPRSFADLLLKRGAGFDPATFGFEPDELPHASRLAPVLPVRLQGRGLVGLREDVWHIVDPLVERWLQRSSAPADQAPRDRSDDS